MGNKAYKDLHVLLGLCVDCSEKALTGLTRCEKHRKSHVENNRELKHWRQANNKCPSCGTPLEEEIDSGNTKCFNCCHDISKPRRHNVLT